MRAGAAVGMPKDFPVVEALAAEEVTEVEALLATDETEAEALLMTEEPDAAMDESLVFAVAAAPVALPVMVIPAMEVD